MSVSLTSLPHVIPLLDGRPSAQVLQLWAATSDEDLRKMDSVYQSSLLFLAVQSAEPLPLVQYLVGERQVCDPQHADVNEQTALYFAARDGDRATCEYLLAAGCDGCSRDSAGQTAMFYASREGHCEVIRLLEERAATSMVNAIDKMGQSALFYAAREGHREACEVLLELGADPSIRDCQKKSAHAYATRGGHVAVGALLKAKSAEARKVVAPEDNRHKVLLQYSLAVSPQQSEWIFPPPKTIEEFEKTFPNIAAWAHIYSSIYQPLDGFTMEWSQTCLDIVNIISNYKSAVWFSKPVDVKALNCPDYYDIVKEPRDLAMIKKKLKDLEYTSIVEFKKDISLIWENCFRYNPAASPVYKAGEHVKELFKKAWAEKGLDSMIEREADLVRALELLR